MTAPPIRTLLLAGERPEGDPLADRFGVAAKALLPIAGRPMILRVLDALAGASTVSSVVVSGARTKLETDADVTKRMGQVGVEVIESAETPATSVVAALDTFPADDPLLVTTADHALLSSEVVDHFVTAALDAEADVIVGLARLETVLETFPGSRRTAFKFRDGAFCGCNLFLFKSRAARRAALTWRTVETERKRPLAIVRRFGLGTLLGYVLRRFTLQGAFTRFSKRIGIRAAPVILPYAMAAVDVDREADVELVTSALENTPRFPG